MTKMEIRNAIISYLELEKAHCALDIGAGTGSVTVQMAKQFPNLQVYGIEKTASGCELIRENARRHSVDIQVIEAEAPTDAIDPETIFDRVYLGGTGHQLEAIMTWLETDHLAANAIIVFSVITVESLSEIMTYLNKHSDCYRDVEGSLIQASRLEALGSYHYFKPQNPCYIIKCQYGGNHA
ncbi:MAG: cobalt-precorrin-6B (C15)-methyltransferase [Clostridiales bacterium]|nr:cobalt-precorrin-6B (C15)-methyltransferase [Clostridiales bacterium]